MDETFEKLAVDIIHHYFKVKGFAFEEHLGNLGWNVERDSYGTIGITYKSSGLQVSEVEVNIAWKAFDEKYPTFEEWAKTEFEKLKK